MNLSDNDLRARWQQAWPAALACWGGMLRLSEPVLLLDEPSTTVPELAWFSIDEVRATVNLRKAIELGIADQPLPVLAHEIGHHVLAPTDLTGLARMVQRCRRGLVDRDDRAAEMANLWSDLLINDRLTRQHHLDMAGPYRAAAAAVVESGRPGVDYFEVFLRTFEILWQLPAQSLTTAQVTAQKDLDAQVLARHARVFARDPIEGAGGFAALMRRWLPEGEERIAVCAIENSGGTAPEIDDADAGGVPLHPALDPRVNPEAPPLAKDDGDDDVPAAGGQRFGPSDLSALYAAMHVERDAAYDWYLRRASRHLVPFPRDEQTPKTEPEMQGLEEWGIGEELSEIDWTATALGSPTVVPGMTTRRRVIIRDAGVEADQRPVDLDLYIDSSQSMPHPRWLMSPAVLAGTVLVLSALRVGARVRVTSWAGPGQVSSTVEFTRDRELAVGELLRYHGGGTSFPLAQMAQAYDQRSNGTTTGRRRCHIAVISDDGVSSMFGKGQPDYLQGVAQAALTLAGGGGTLVLMVPDSLLDEARAIAGDYTVLGVGSGDMIEFARAFTQRHWGSRQR
ncbi:hypothetical protein [Calidifontibacter terrae]